jgi:hypothetical protein
MAVKYAVWVTSTLYCDGRERPAEIHSDLDTLVRRSESLGHEEPRYHFFTVLDAEHKDWWPLGYLFPGATRPAFHHRDGIVNPGSRQAVRYYRARQRNR